jgi:hypothetical protein
MNTTDKMVNRGRHEAACRVCAHPEREQIESEWCAWANTSELAKQYGLSRDSLYRHCHALGLFERRGRNLKGALEKIIEQADSVAVNAGAVVQAIQAYAKINAAGQWVEKIEQVNLNDLFERMTAQELEQYAKTGNLPLWFRQTTGATAADGCDDKENEKNPSFTGKNGKPRTLTAQQIGDGRVNVEPGETPPAINWYPPIST